MQRKTSFKKVVVCHTNDFKPEINDKIKTWVEANGGTFTKELSPNVTHLIASKEAWKRYHPLVKEARRTRSIHIVQYDWLEDSLLHKPIRALPVEKYLFEQTKLKPTRIVRAASVNQSVENIKIPRDPQIEPAGIQFDRVQQEFVHDMGTAGFHPYSDTTGFVYIITLLRYDFLKNRFEKFRHKVCCSFPPVPSDVNLPTSIKRASHIHIAEPWGQYVQLFESDQEPHTYACYTQYTRPGTRKQVLILAPPGSTWEYAWNAFSKWFLRKVGTKWEDRSRNGVEITIDEENPMGWYQYQAPKVGQPEGVRT